MERRRHPRVPLDKPYYAELLLNDADGVAVMLVDIGTGGAQLSLSPGNANPAVLLGLSVTLRKLPAPLDPEKQGIAGKIVWMASQRCGMRFTQPQTLSGDQFAAFAKSL